MPGRPRSVSPAFRLLATGLGATLAGGCLLAAGASLFEAHDGGIALSTVLLLEGPVELALAAGIRTETLTLAEWRVRYEADVAARGLALHGGFGLGGSLLRSLGGGGLGLGREPSSPFRGARTESVSLCHLLTDP